MCFVPGRRNGVPFFNISTLNVQKWSEHVVILAFWLRWASRHSDVQFLISYLPRWLRTRRFSEPTFRPSEAIKHWKKTECFTTPFRAPASSFFWLFLFSDILSSSFLFSDSSHLCFSICPCCFFLRLTAISTPVCIMYLYVMCPLPSTLSHCHCCQESAPEATRAVEAWPDALGPCSACATRSR